MINEYTCAYILLFLFSVITADLNLFSLIHCHSDIGQAGPAFGGGGDETWGRGSGSWTLGRIDL
jgi:hypothetical protein